MSLVCVDPELPVMPCIITGFLPKSSSPSVPTSMSNMLNVFSTVVVILISCYCLSPILQTVLPPPLYYRGLPYCPGAFPLPSLHQLQRSLQTQARSRGCCCTRPVLLALQGWSLQCPQRGSRVLLQPC